MRFLQLANITYKITLLFCKFLETSIPTIQHLVFCFVFFLISTSEFCLLERLCHYLTFFVIAISAVLDGTVHSAD